MDEKSPKDPFASIPITSADQEADSEDLDVVIESSETAPADTEEPQEEQQGQSPLFPRRSRKDRSSSRWYKWLLAIVVCGCCLYLLTGFILVPFLVRSYLPKRLSFLLERPVTLGDAEFNPFTFSLVLHNGIIGPKLSDKNDTIDPVFSFSRWEMDFEAISLLKRGLVCKKINIDRFFLHVVRFQDATYNITELLPSAFRDVSLSPPPRDDGKRTRPHFPFSLNNISITGGRLVFYDTPSEKTHTIEEITLALPVLSNIPYATAGYIKPEFSAKVNGSPIKVVGQTKVLADGYQTRLEMHLNAVDLPSYFAYIPQKPEFALAKGKADLALDLLFSTVKPVEERLQINGEARIVDLWLKDHSGKNIANIPEIEISGTFSPLARKYLVRDLKIKKPEFNLERAADGNFILGGAVLQRLQDAQSGRGLKPYVPQGLAVDVLTVEEGKVSFVDRAVQGGFADTWFGIRLVVNGLSAINEADRNKPAAFTLQAQKETGKNSKVVSLQGKGTVTAFPFRIECSLNIDHLPLSAFQPYADSAEITGTDNLQIKKGWVDIQGRLIFASGAESEGPSLVVKDTTVDLQDLVLADRKHEWLKVSSLAFRQAAVNLPARTIDFGGIKVEDGLVSLGVGSQKVFSVKERQEMAAGMKQQGTRWRVAMQTLNMNRFVIAGTADRPISGKDVPEDEMPRVPPSPLKIILADVFMQFSSQPDQPTEKSAQRVAGSALVNRRGRLNFIGSMAFLPFEAELDCTLSDLELEGIKPLINNWFNREVSGGVLSAKGVVHLPGFSFNGSLRINDFAAKSHSPAAGPVGEVVASWHEAFADDFSLVVDPFALKTSKIIVDRPYLLCSLLDNGKSTLAGLFLGFPATTGKKNKNTLFEIGAIKLAGGSLSFVDRHTSPVYRSGIDKISGSILSLRNQAGKRTSYALEGVLDNVTPIQVAGSISLIDEESLFESKVKIDGMDIKPLSPYLEPYLGWEIAQGKFFLQADYQQTGRQIEVENYLKIDGIKLGKNIQQDKNLPLTIALLTDPTGLINLEFPIKAETTDFSYREHLLKILRNLLIKTAVSPFSLLNGSIEQELLSSSEDRLKEDLFFPFGNAELTQEAREELAFFAQILRMRPGLILEIRGCADTKGDRDALLAERKRQATYERVVEEIRMSKEISKTYGKEEITTPYSGISNRPDKGPMQGERPDIKIDEDELRRLAEERSRKVFRFFIDELAIAEDRLTMGKEAKLISSHSLGRSGNRVDFFLGSGKRR